MKEITARDKARLIAELAHEKKGENIILMNMGDVSTMCDWFVLVSASSSRRINSISNNIQRKLSEYHIKPFHVEGKSDPFWVLLDYYDVVVHVFTEEVREFYGLERLWSDAGKERFDNKCLRKTHRNK